MLRAGEPVVAEPVATTLAPSPDAGPLRAQRLDVAVGGLPGGGGCQSSPVHVQLLITATVDPAIEIGTGVVRIEPLAVGGLGGLRIPFDVVPGGTGAIVVNLWGLAAPGNRCDQWALQSSIPTQIGASPNTGLEVTWQLEVRAWRLVPDPAPMTLALDVR